MIYSNNSKVYIQTIFDFLLLYFFQNYSIIHLLSFPFGCVFLFYSVSHHLAFSLQEITSQFFSTLQMSFSAQLCTD